MDYIALSAKARAGLIIAAMRRSPVTYGELGRALDIDDSMPLSHHINRVLDLVSKQCLAAGEPSLAVLAVNSETGEPGSGFRAGSVPWHQEARQCYRNWPPA